MVDKSEPLEHFESWLLRRVAQAVEAGEVSSDLLTDLRDEFEAAREKPPEVGIEETVRIFAEITRVSRERAEEMLASLEAQPSVTRETVLRRVAEVWLNGQPRAKGPRRNTCLTV